MIQLVLISLLVGSTMNSPVSQQYCPVIKDTEPGAPVGSKVINMDAVEGHKIRLQFSYPNGNSLEKSSLESSEETTTGTTEGENGTNKLQHDIYCQWDFQTGNESQFLLLTFDKLSAPFSEDCSEAFIAMQKQNAFESRWCGNRKKANSRPMTLFSRGTAKVSVFHKANAPMSPNTGFTVIVEAVNASMIEGGKNALRVLLG